MSVEIICGDARSALAGMAEQSVHCVVTSPPYWNLRDYGTAQWDGGDPACLHRESGPARTAASMASSSLAGSKANTHRSHHFGAQCRRCGATRQDRQIGLEVNPQDYIAALVEVFAQVWRVLRDDGTCWIVIGDSYAGSWGNQGRKAERGTQRPINGSMLQKCDGRYPATGHKTGAVPAGLKPKDLMMIPHRMAIALQDEGWYVRNDCVWSKGSAMPESVQDRFSRAHEYVFHLAKSERYYFDACAVAERCTGHQPGTRGVGDWNKLPAETTNGRRGSTLHRRPASRNRRTVLHINPQPFSAARFGVKDIDHYAVFPEKLVEICLLAGTSEAGCCPQCGTPWQRVVERSRRIYPNAIGNGTLNQQVKAVGQVGRTSCFLTGQGTVAQTVGWQPACPCDAGMSVPCTVLDPFCGSGTTLLVAKRLGRDGVGIDLNPEYCRLAQRRCASIPYPLFSAAGCGADEGAAR